LQALGEALKATKDSFDVTVERMTFEEAKIVSSPTPYALTTIICPTPFPCSTPGFLFLKTLFLTLKRPL